MPVPPSSKMATTRHWSGMADISSQRRTRVRPWISSLVTGHLDLKRRKTMSRIHIEEWPPYTPSEQAKKDNVLLAAKLMTNAALTAPFTGGVGGIEAEIAYGQKELEDIAREMERLANHEVPERLKKPFLYEAVMVRESDVVVFIGNYRAHSTPMDAACGLCGGEQDCSFVYNKVKHVNGLVDTTDRQRTTAIKGPLCTLRAHDVGYAVGSALWVAANLFVDTKP